MNIEVSYGSVRINNNLMNPSSHLCEGVKNIHLVQNLFHNMKIILDKKNEK